MILSLMYTLSWLCFWILKLIILTSGFSGYILIYLTLVFWKMSKLVFLFVIWRNLFILALFAFKLIFLVTGFPPIITFISSTTSFFIFYSSSLNILFLNIWSSSDSRQLNYDSLFKTLSLITSIIWFFISSF